MLTKLLFPYDLYASVGAFSMIVKSSRPSLELYPAHSPSTQHCAHVSTQQQPLEHLVLPPPAAGHKTLAPATTSLAIIYFISQRAD